MYGEEREEREEGIDEGYIRGKGMNEVFRRNRQRREKEERMQGEKIVRIF